MKDFYYILGLEIKATEQQVKVAHRKLSMKFHPDKNEGDGYFTERFKEIQEAYETLSDTSKRVIYDSKLKNYKFGNVNNDSLKTYEEELKRQYERELRKKEEEIRQKYQTPAQRAFEEAENARKEAEAKKKAEQKRISDEIRSSKDILAQKESAIVNLQREAVDLRNRIAHLETLIGNIPDWNFDSNKNYDRNPLSYPNILTELNRIKSEVPIQKRTVFIKAFLRFAKLHSIESNFENRHPDLVQLILQAVIKVEPFEKIHKILQKEPQLVDEFEAKVLSYVNSTSI